MLCLLLDNSALHNQPRDAIPVFATASVSISQRRHLRFCYSWFFAFISEDLRNLLCIHCRHMRDFEPADELSGLQGFRKRWRQAVSTSDSFQDSIENLNDCAEHSNSLDTALDAVSALEESDPNGLLDIPLDSVSVPEVSDLEDENEGFSLVDDVIGKDDIPPPTLMVATAKSKPRPVDDFTIVTDPRVLEVSRELQMNCPPEFCMHA